mgnify:CR=1 FL=1
MTTPLSIAVLGSGKGSNFQAIAQAIDSGTIDARVACVISDVPDAFILDRARQRNVPACHIDAGPSKTRLDGIAEQKAIAFMRLHGADTIVLAGFMRMIKQGLLAAFPNRIVNIHPSLLQAFPGLESWKQALDYGAKFTGCTVHFVDNGMDTGPIILQRAVPVLDDDTPATLHARIQEQEHTAYPQALTWLAEGRLQVQGRRVTVRA